MPGRSATRSTVPSSRFHVRTRPFSEPSTANRSSAEVATLNGESSSSSSMRSNGREAAAGSGDQTWTWCSESNTARPSLSPAATSAGMPARWYPPVARSTMLRFFESARTTLSRARDCMARAPLLRATSSGSAVPSATAKTRACWSPATQPTRRSPEKVRFCIASGLRQRTSAVGMSIITVSVVLRHASERPSGDTRPSPQGGIGALPTKVGSEPVAASTPRSNGSSRWFSAAAARSSAAAASPVRAASTARARTASGPRVSRSCVGSGAGCAGRAAQVTMAPMASPAAATAASGHRAERTLVGRSGTVGSRSACSRASAKAPASSKRSDGSRRRERCTTGPRRPGSVGTGSCTTARRVAVVLARWNGRWPVSSSSRHTPKAHTSARLSKASPMTCSGLIVAGVPKTWPAAVCSGALSTASQFDDADSGRAMPQSMTKTRPRVSTNTLSSLMSRCTMPIEWACCSTLAAATRCGTRLRPVVPASASSARVLPCRAGMANQARPSSSVPASMTGTTPGTSRAAVMRASRSRRRAAGPSAPPATVFNTIWRRSSGSSASLTVDITVRARVAPRR